MVNHDLRDRLHRTSAKPAKYLVTVLKPDSAASEAYRILRTNLLYTRVDKPSKIIVLTSPGPSEGKSTTCANLGVVLAQAGKTVLIIDCDFRRPSIHKFFGLQNVHGVVDILIGERGLQEVSKEPVERLKVIPVGPILPNPAELLSSQRFSEFLASLRDEYDYVLVDVSPTLLAADATIVAAQGDGVLLVIDAQNTRKSSVRKSMRSLEALGITVFGTVMNNAKSSPSGYGYHDQLPYGGE